MELNIKIVLLTFLTVTLSLFFDLLETNIFLIYFTNFQRVCINLLKCLINTPNVFLNIFPPRQGIKYQKLNLEKLTEFTFIKHA